MKILSETYFQVICTKGHQLGYLFFEYPDEKYCELCGSSLISSCQNCNKVITGWINNSSEDFIDFPPDSMDVPKFCKFCGDPYPWTKQIIDDSVELLALDADLSDDDKKLIKDSIPDLIIESSSTPLAEAKFKKGISSAALFVKDAIRNLLVDVVSETVKKSIFPN